MPPPEREIVLKPATSGVPRSLSISVVDAGELEPAQVNHQGTASKA